MPEDIYKDMKLSVRELSAIHTIMSHFHQAWSYTPLAPHEYQQLLDKLEIAIIGRRFDDVYQGPYHT